MVDTQSETHTLFDCYTVKYGYKHTCGIYITYFVFKSLDFVKHIHKIMPSSYSKDIQLGCIDTVKLNKNFASQK